MEVRYVNFAAQYQQEKEQLHKAIDEVLERGDFILGQSVSAFEEDFAKLCGVKYALGVANGTDSLVIAMKALGIGTGDEVITPPNSWVSSTSSVILAGATPVFADVDDDQNISVAAIEKAITSKTKAIMPVHLTGRCADMDGILKLARRYQLHVIEDAAQAVTARRGSHTAGGAGIVGSFSLHPLKNLNACGDAGILTTDNEELYQKMKLLRHHGLKNRDEIEIWGFNSRLDTIQAAILRTRIPRIHDTIEKRRNTAQRYTSALQDIVTCPLEGPDEFHTYHVYVIQCDRRDELKHFLEKNGIETKIHYPIPIHLQKAAFQLGHSLGSFPKTEKQAGRILSLPVHQFLDLSQVDWVISKVRQFYR